MIAVKKEGIIIQKTVLDFENEGILNPASIKEGNNIHLLCCHRRACINQSELLKKLMLNTIDHD
ncbi:hypothetical protein ACM55M_04745 [Flavobacterium sp. ZT3R25]|uniref:hypothetical protein n=1 Tax=Flavobacterium galactosi TaxID=3398735 RepID=UPI003A84CD56